MGSLFKLRDYWSIKFNEEFDSKAFFVANVDNETSGAPKIIVGSYQGVLRIFQPKTKGFRAEDVLLEKKFNEPILQLSCGNFLPNNQNRNTLAILFPRRLVLASVTRFGNKGGRGGEGADGDAGQATDFFLQLNIHAEHRFEHTSYNFTQGAFGNTTGSSTQDLLCVQSMDGQLSFVDHNKTLFQRFLPSTHFLVPGFLQYCPKIDSFLTSSSSYELHCYKFQTFAQSTGSETKDESQHGRKIAVDWSFNLGEDVMDIQFCRLTRGLPNNQVDIVVLCERTLFVLKDNGELRFNKRLDVAAACCYPYSLPDNKNHNLIIGTHTNSMLVYSDTTLQWSAKMPSTPLAFSVGNFGGVNGMIVSLQDGGLISLNYLGTDPANNPVQVLESKELDYDAMDEEHRRLQQMIRQAVNQPKQEPKDLIKLKIEAPTSIALPQRTCTIVVNVIYTGTAQIENATLITSTTEPIVADQPTVIVPLIPAGETLFIPINFYVVVDQDRLIPTTLVADVVISYESSTGETLTAKSSVVLPFGMVAAPVPPLKNIQFKLQIDTNKAPPPSLQELFQDVAMLGEVSPNVLSVQYVNGADATILVSKNAGRYRVQSSSMEGLWLLTSELVRRLKLLYRNDRTEPLRIDVPEPLPLDEYFSMIDMHCLMRDELNAAQQRLAEMAHQFRAIQKRLLVRFRDRNPTPLNSLEQLFEETYRRLHVCADEVDVATSRLRQAGSMLTCSTHTLLLLTRYRCQDTFSKDDFDVLRQYLSPMVPNASPGGLGWEEITDANMMHLLRTALSRNAKESGSVPQPLAPSTDASKVKKHLTIVLDRICKGASLTNTQMAGVEVAERKPKAAPLE